MLANPTNNTIQEKVHYLDKLAEKFYCMALIPVCRKYEANEEKHNEDKIGGEKPFMRLGESWPLSTDGAPMRFVLQLTVPSDADVPFNSLRGASAEPVGVGSLGGDTPEFKGKTIRLFIDGCDDELSSSNIHVTYIDYSEPFQDLLKAPTDYGQSSAGVLKPFAPFKVIGFEKHKEFNSLAYQIGEDDDEVMASIFGWAKLRELACDETMGVGLPEPENLPELSEGYDPIHVPDEIRNPPDEVKARPFTGIKIGGYPTSCQDCEEYYLRDGMLLQIGLCDVLKWYYGDMGEMHINPDTKQVGGDCC